MNGGDHTWWDRPDKRLPGRPLKGASVHLVTATPLTVVVRTPDGTAVNDVEVEVHNLRKEPTGSSSNQVTFKILGDEYNKRVKTEGNKVTIKVRKAHFGPPSQNAGEAVAVFDFPKGKPASFVMVLQASANLSVKVAYAPVPAPVTKANVTVKGPVTQAQSTDSAGVAKFVDLPAGTYAITASYTETNALVDLAKSKVGSTDWAYSKERQVGSLGKFPAGSNKCNLFVYEMVTGAGYSVPTKIHTRRLHMGSYQIPPNAGDWASPTGSVGTSEVIASPEPGDVVAWSHPEWTDATGHVAIISYPEDAKQQSKNLAPGDNVAIDLQMRRRVIGANQFTVDEDDHHFWHYYDENNTAETALILFRRLNK